MNLTDLGFDLEFAERAAPFRQSGRDIARVTAVDRDAFLVRNQAAEIPAALAGRFRFAVQSPLDLPCVGDWVAVQGAQSGGPAMIHHVIPRKTVLRRKCPGQSVDFQMLAANIDVAFIIQDCLSDFNVSRLERYRVVIHDGQIEPRIILSKTDLVSPAELERRMDQIRCAGITAPVLPLSNASGLGLADFGARLAPGKTYCLLGSSGVGKTTLINRLTGHAPLATQPVSATGEGVHTTTRRQLLILESGALLIDTPGLRELGLLDASDGLDATFSDIGAYAAHCRFPDCTHTQEPGCAVLAALKNKTLGADRYQNYLKLRKETEFHGLSYVEKRRKDRAFGRFVKSTLKQMRD